MTTTTLPAGTSVEDALEELSTAFDQVLKLAADQAEDLNPVALLAVFTKFETLRNRLPLLDHVLIAAADGTDLAEAHCQPNTKRLLVRTLRLSEREAAARVAAAQALGQRRSMLGQALAPVRPVLAAAQAAGEVTPEQAGMIIRELGAVDRRGFDPADIALGEQQLTAHATVFNPKELKPILRRVIDHIDPDGTLPDEQLNHDRRFLTLRQTSDGAYAGEFRLTATVGAQLAAVLDGLVKPRPDRIPLPDGGELVTVDERSHGQKCHDALGEILDRVLRAGDAPGLGGLPATVIVTIDYDHLLTGTGWGTTSDGTPISTPDLLALANEADIIPTVLTATGAPLDLGRSQRIASRPQTLALIARDGGCSFPACDRTPEWCQRHHIIEWIDDGPTDLDNLTLLCTYHHHHFEQRGWTCEINDQRLPQWRPPKWIDHHQRPIMNSRVGKGRAP